MGNRPQLIHYTTSVGPGVEDETEAGFAREVDRVLTDPRGWKKYGYTFVRDAVRLPSNPLSFDDDSEDEADMRPLRAGEPLHIHLETAAEAGRACGIEGFSCWRPRARDVVIHADNWQGRSASRLPLEQYHNYVISHEVGHALGLPHQACPAEECARRGRAPCPASIMQQATRGPDHIRPCVENDWPLDPDWQIDDPRPALARPAFLLVCVLLCLLVYACAWLLAHAWPRARTWPAGWRVAAGPHVAGRLANPTGRLAYLVGRGQN
jgi:hypothetical protein